MSVLRVILPLMSAWILYDISTIRASLVSMNETMTILSSTVTKNKEISNENYYLLSNEFKTELGGVKERLVRLETYQDVRHAPFSSPLPSALMEKAP